jgi:hypothetical protein
VKPGPFFPVCACVVHRIVPWPESAFPNNLYHIGRANQTPIGKEMAALRLAKYCRLR